MRYLPAILLSIAILLAPLVWHFSSSLFTGGGLSGGPAVDSGARIELEMLRQQIEELQSRVRTLEQQSALEPREVEPDVFGGRGENSIRNAYAQVVLIANRRQVNRGLTVPTPQFLAEFLGRPRENLTDECQPITNPDMAAMLRLEQVGPIQVHMLEPALKSLRRVFDNVLTTDTDLYERIRSSGSLCVRRIRGSDNKLSSHAFGLAIDLNIDGQLDSLADGKTQLGLTILADFFQTEGWIWGAGFGREDSMHFEVSRELLESWRKEGLI
ncbi:MAG: M15 family metallopeptidase [Paracoccaceae bacterium]